MRIAFFSLGNMGFPIAENLLKSGFSVTTATHRNPEPTLRLQALGGRIAPSPAEAVKDAEFIFTIVPEDSALLELLLDPELADAVAPGTVIVDMTSASPKAVQTVAEFYAPRGVAVLDAPILLKSALLSWRKFPQNLILLIWVLSVYLLKNLFHVKGY